MKKTADARTSIFFASHTEENRVANIPAGSFVIFEVQDQSIEEFYKVRKRRSTHFKALKL